MVWIIPGGINSGKSRLIKELFRRHGGAGFVSEKVFDNEILQGYDLVELGSWKRTPFIRFRELVPAGWKEAFTYGPFSFSVQGLTRGVTIINKAVEKRISPIYIDEIGPVEIEGKGFAQAFVHALHSGLSVVAVCRETLIDGVIARFSITEWRILDTLDRFHPNN